jgi:EAL domain-containing protein (putative c-di-GMP-specific phosphodiesterase class I)
VTARPRPPGEFIPRAEQTRQIVPIGDWVLRATCEEVRRWRRAGLPPMKTAVNISVVQIEQPDFLAKLLGILEEYGFEGSCFEIEITEHGLVKQRDNVINKLRKLSAHGITIAIDDFGTGYSSLSYLQQFPIHTLKIDRSFVGDIEAPGQEACIVDAIAAMAHGLRLNLVAEGVETEVQLEYLRQRGCSQAQGFLFGRPLSAQDTFELLGRLPDGRLGSCLARKPPTR